MFGDLEYKETDFEQWNSTMGFVFIFNTPAYA